MTIDYLHASNAHTCEGARIGYRYVSTHTQKPITSLIDVGCGTGTWLRAALDQGVTDVSGVDGVMAPASELAVPAAYIQRIDLTAPFKLDRRFSVALCLEVAEHLVAAHAPSLVQSLTDHANTIVFSAACPNQPGQHHVNCQWPEYWQEIFNAQGYMCDDSIRWAMWTEPKVEPWYRQNMFIARRAFDKAGKEPRLRPVLHPEMVSLLKEQRKQQLRGIERGAMPFFWYLTTFTTAVVAKACRRLGVR